MEDHVYTGTIARRCRVSSERARQWIDAELFGPVQRDAFGRRFVSREALEAFAREREQREKVEAGRR